MKLIKVLTAMLLAFFFMNVSYAAGNPINEDFTQLLALSNKAIVAGDEGNTAAFLESAEAAVDRANVQINQRNSMSLERLLPRLKAAVRQGKAGDLSAGTESVKEAVSYMGDKPAPKFGGGN